MRDIKSIYNIFKEEFEDNECSLWFDNLDPSAGYYKIGIANGYDDGFVDKAKSFQGKHDGWKVEGVDVFTPDPPAWDGYEVWIFVRAKAE